MPGPTLIQSRETRAHASEVKFLVTSAIGAQIREWARTHLAADAYGIGPHGDEYRTTTLYLDTPRLDVLQRHGSFGRAKYRIRRYLDGDCVFLERKLRRPGMVAKRRTRLAVEDLAQLSHQGAADEWPGQWFQRRLLARGVAPVCQVSYHRTARGAPGRESAARLTLDDDIRAAPARELSFDPDAGVALLGGRTILELKYRGHPPALFKHLVEEFRLEPQTVSKYRVGMGALGHARPAGAATGADAWRGEPARIAVSGV